MPETTESTAVTTELRACCVCGINVIGGTAVAIVEKGTGPARLLHACAPCLKRHNILPLDEQDDPIGDGRLMFRGQ